MNRSSILRLALALILTLTSFAHAAAETNPDTGERQAETLALEIERMFGDLLGGQEIRPVYQEHGGGLSSLSFTLPADVEKHLAAAGDSPAAPEKAKSILCVASGISLIEPSSASSLIHTALSDRRFDYNYWWVVVNLTRDQDLERTTTAKLAGPGKKFNVQFDLTYKAKTVHLFWYAPNRSVDKAGVYTFQVTVPGGGAIVSRTVAK